MTVNLLVFCIFTKSVKKNAQNLLRVGKIFATLITITVIFFKCMCTCKYIYM